MAIYFSCMESTFRGNTLESARVLDWWKPSSVFSKPRLPWPMATTLHLDSRAFTKGLDGGIVHFSGLIDGLRATTKVSSTVLAFVFRSEQWQRCWDTANLCQRRNHGITDIGK